MKRNIVSELIQKIDNLKRTNEDNEKILFNIFLNNKFDNESIRTMINNGRSQNFAIDQIMSSLQEYEKDIPLPYEQDDDTCDDQYFENTKKISNSYLDMDDIPE
jgi:hypothetical protein